MADISSIIDNIHPAVSGLSTFVSDTIWVLFNQEIDETSIEDGNFFVTGPDFNTWSGPDNLLYLDKENLVDESELLQSPGYAGFVAGAITFERISLTTTNEVTTEDTIGSGHLFRSKAIFTPTNNLKASTEYTVHVTGIDTSTSLGISPRTVFDTTVSGANAGTGEVTFEGGYFGSVDSDVYRLNITTSGEIGTARFTFVRDSDPSTTYGPFKAKRSGVTLEDGVVAKFADGLYRTSDQFSVVVKEQPSLSGSYIWTFETGSGSILDIPTTISTSVIGDPITSVSSSSTSSTLSVSSTYPVDETSDLTLVAGTFNITVTFNNDINASTVASGITTTVYAESVTGEADIDANGTLIALPSVSDNVLTITVASGQLYNNNLVTVTIDSTIEDTDGNALGSDYEFWFTTEYSPMYSSLRLVNLKIGSFITGLKDDTINLAIFVASREADSLTWNTESDNDYYIFARGQWTTCRAAQILLMNTLGMANNIKSKKLGDLAVEYNINVDRPFNLIEQCLARWEGVVQAGGRQVQTPSYVVKGDSDNDKPAIGRTWFNDHDYPATNIKYKPAYSRRYRGTYYPRGWYKK